jgi:hypothetical protein
MLFVKVNNKIMNLNEQIIQSVGVCDAGAERMRRREDGQNRCELAKARSAFATYKRVVPLQPPTTLFLYTTTTTRFEALLMLYSLHEAICTLDVDSSIPP